MSTQDEQEQLPFQERRPDRSPLRPRDFGSSEDSLENGEGTRRPFKYSRHENTEGRREYRPRFRSEQDGEDGVRRPRFHRNQDGEGDGFRPRFSRERGEDREEPGPIPAAGRRIYRRRMSLFSPPRSDWPFSGGRLTRFTMAIAR